MNTKYSLLSLIIIFSLSYPSRIISNDTVKPGSSSESINQLSIKYSDQFTFYGPIKLNKYVKKNRNNIVIVEAMNKNNQLIYVALSCKKKLLNVTGINLDWKGWVKPEFPFENQILNDFCNN